MNVSTRLELQTLLQNIKGTQMSPEASPLAYRAAWVTLIVAPLIGIGLAPFIGASNWGFPLTMFLWLFFWFFVQALYTIIQHKVNMRLRPILEALLYVPEEPAKREEQISKKAVKVAKARPSRGRKK
jgi:hypothetical protein